MNFPKEYEEKIILGLVATGDEKAFSVLFNAWRDKLFLFLIKLGATRESAEDSLQEIFMKLWLNRSGLSTVSNFNAYLYKAARNHIINQVYRMTSELSALATINAKGSAILKACDDELIHKQLQEIIQNTVENLPPQQKQVYKLGRVEGYKQEQIAAQMRISVSTVKNHMTQALKTIKDRIRRAYIILFIFMAALIFCS